MTATRSIQMVDLRRQHQVISEQLSEAYQRVMDSGQFIGGPEVNQFAQELGSSLDIPHVIPCANGTDALQIALMALGLQAGDEVITPAFTYAATVEVIVLLGMTPVFVDVEPTFFSIDASQLEDAISDRTRAIIPVHLFGQCADMDTICRIANKKGVHVIEDTAQAIGAKYIDSAGNTSSAGALGDLGCTSFFPSKNLGCFGDGGAMFTRNESLAKRCRMIANHGQGQKYYHDVIGCNSRLDALQAALLRVKLPHLSDYNKRREDAAARYDALFEGCDTLARPRKAPYSTHVYHQYTLTLAEGLNREQIRAKLQEKGIPSMVYYPIPLHLQKAYQTSVFGEGSMPHSESLARRVLSLPMHPELDADEQQFIAEALMSACSERR